MVQQTDLRQIRRRVYMSYFQDGLWDILLGLALMSWGLVFLFNLGWLPGGLIIVMYSMVFALKRQFTYPRIGYARTTEAQKITMRMGIAGGVLALLGVAVLLLFAVGSRPDWLGEYFIFLFGCLLALVVSIIAYWWKVNRWYGYAMLVVAGVAFHQWLDTPLPLSIVVPGGIVLLSGTAILIRFLRENPRQVEE